MNDYERALIRYVVDGDIRNAQKQAKIILNKIATEKDRKFKEYQLKKLDNKGPELIELPYNLQKILCRGRIKVLQQLAKLPSRKRHVSSTLTLCAICMCVRSADGTGPENQRSEMARRFESYHMRQ